MNRMAISFMFLLFMASVNKVTVIVTMRMNQGARSVAGIVRFQLISMHMYWLKLNQHYQ